MVSACICYNYSFEDTSVRQNYDDVRIDFTLSLFYKKCFFVTHDGG